MTAVRLAIENTVDAMSGEIESIFNTLKQGTQDVSGVTRASYGEGENFAHRVMADLAIQAGLELSTDAAANTYMALPGRDRSLPKIVMGSHLDSVKCGGNYDGAAGVVAALCALIVLKKLGITPQRDLVAMGIRAEESVWFQVSYLGSRAALGQLPADALQATRIDTGTSLREHIRDAGGDPEALESGSAPLGPHNVKAFLELHIEQAPMLVEEQVPVGIGRAVPGMVMYPDAVIRGVYGHVGTPRKYRKDAVVAAAELVTALDREWQALDAEGKQVAVTLGRFHTNADEHGLTTVPGELFFSIDMRGYEPAVIERLENTFLETIERIKYERAVSIDLGERRTAPLGLMDESIQDELMACAAAQGIAHLPMYSPACHDAGAFAAAGIPTGMIFIRNENGSHNPYEAMSTDDFLSGLKVLVQWLARQDT